MMFAKSSTVHLLGYLVTFIFLIILISSSEQVEVTTKLGKLEGIQFKSESGKSAYGFLGIPYAQPPVGELRFKLPRPIAHWENVRNATKFGQACIQSVNHEKDKMNTPEDIFGGEDCLYLNVFTPKIPSSTKDDPNKLLPVLFYIHGGSFTIGSAKYKTKMLMDRDIVVVTINYRLGPLGFLSTGDSELPGNFGMWDQVEALKWVRDHISAFGGNPDLVTVSGSSAGGASSIYHMLSPASAGLFHRVIALSGNALCPWALQEKPGQFAKLLAQDLGCDISSSKSLATCMKDIPAVEMIKASQKYVFGDFYPIIYGPVVEKTGSPRFLSEDPLTLLQSNRIETRVPVIMGVTGDEGIMFYNRVALHNKLDKSFYKKKLAEYLRNTTDLQGNLDKVAKTVRKFYFNDLHFARDEKKVIEAASQMIGDIYFYADNDRTLRLLAKHNIPTYMFAFEHEAKFSIMDILGTPKGKTAHLDDLFYIFELELRDSYRYTLSKEDKAVSDKMLSFWKYFLNHGKPSSDNSEWPRYDLEKTEFLLIREGFSVDKNYLSERMKLWNEEIPKILAKENKGKEEL